MKEKEDFVAIDFETANRQHGSACQIGLVHATTDGQILSSFSSLICPDTDLGIFDPRHSAIHSITAKTVANAPTMAEIADVITSFLGDRIVLAHYMSFDYAEWCEHARRGHLPELKNQRLCTHAATKLLFDRTGKHNDLETIVEEFAPGVQFQHHSAVEDARAAACVLAGLLRRSGKSINDLLEMAGSQGDRDLPGGFSRMNT